MRIMCDTDKLRNLENADEPAQTYSWLSYSILNSLMNVPSHSWNSFRVIVCLFALMTMLFRLNEYPSAVNEQQKV